MSSMRTPWCSITQNNENQQQQPCHHFLLFIKVPVHAVQSQSLPLPSPCWCSIAIVRSAKLSRKKTLARVPCFGSVLSVLMEKTISSTNAHLPSATQLDCFEEDARPVEILSLTSEESCWACFAFLLPPYLS